MSLRRRQFVRSTGAWCGLAALRQRCVQADDFTVGLKVGVQSYTFRKFSIDRAVAVSAKLGFHYIELSRTHLPPDASAEQIQAVKNLCGQHGLHPIAYGVERFTADHDANRRLFDFAKSLGITMLGADPAPNSFDSLEKLVEEYDIAIGIHPHGPGGNRLHQWYSAEVILDAVRHRHPKIGACLDTGHLIRAAQPPFNKRLDPAEQIRMMGSRNFGIHLKDHDNERRTDVVVGRGRLNVSEVLTALKEVGFAGGLSIEYEASPEDPTDDVRNCLEALREAAKTPGITIQ